MSEAAPSQTTHKNRPLLQGQEQSREESRIPFVKRLKMALNRLGYFIPDHKKGMNDLTYDAQLTEAAKRFEQDQLVLQADGIIEEGGTTAQRIDEALERQLSGTLIAPTYIWRSVDDDKVRNDHAARDGQRFSWDNPPDGGHPGEDYNCRCWAEPVGVFDVTPKVPLPPKPPLRKADPLYHLEDGKAQSVLSDKLLLFLLSLLSLHPSVKAFQIFRNKRLLPKKSIEAIETLRGMSFRQVEKLADAKFLKEGWKKAPIKRGEGVKYTDGKGGSFQINKGYKGSDNVHGGPYIKTTIGSEKVRIPLKGNPTK